MSSRGTSDTDNALVNAEQPGGTPDTAVTNGLTGDDGQPYFVEEAQVAAHEYGSAVASLQYLGMAAPTFDQVVGFIEKSRAYSAKSFAGQEAAKLRLEERQLQLQRDKTEAEAMSAERQLQLQRDQKEHEAKTAERQLQLQKEERADEARFAAQSRLEDRISFEARLRGILAMVLVLGSLGGVLYGLFAEVDPQALTQYLAPVTGLAGIVIGYFFGRESKPAT